MYEQLVFHDKKMDVKWPVAEWKIQVLNSKPYEMAVLKEFNSFGWAGVHGEGHGIRTILRALLLPVLRRFVPFGGEDCVMTHAFHALIQMCFNPNLPRLKKTCPSKEQFLFLGHNCIDERLNERFALLQKDYYLLSTSRYNALGGPQISSLPISLFINALPIKIWHDLFDTFVNGSFDLAHGWPDLELSNGEDVMLVEVKVKDRLTEWQKNTIPALVKLGFNCQIVRAIVAKET